MTINENNHICALCSGPEINFSSSCSGIDNAGLYKLDGCEHVVHKDCFLEYRSTTSGHAFRVMCPTCRKFARNLKLGSDIINLKLIPHIIKGTFKIVQKDALTFWFERVYEGDDDPDQCALDKETDYPFNELGIPGQRIKMWSRFLDTYKHLPVLPPIEPYIKGDESSGSGV
jgi:hypothetical protein